MRWLCVCALALLFSAAPASAAPMAPGEYERAVLSGLNAVRLNPAAYVGELRRYRNFYHANLVVVPGQQARWQTEEGVAPLDEAMVWLAAHRATSLMAPGTILAASARDHATEQAESGTIGHGGRGGLSPSDRAEQRGGGPYVAELITYGANDPDDVVRQLVIDDGVLDRGHRLLLFAPQFHFAGVACGPHPVYRTMCVIDLAETADGSDPADHELDIAAR